MTEYYTLTLDPINRSFFESVAPWFIVLAMGGVLLVLAMISGVATLLMRRSIRIKEVAVALVILSGLFVAAGVVMAFGQYESLQTEAMNKTAERQAIALRRLDLTDVHVTPFVGANDRTYYYFSAIRKGQPVTGGLEPLEPLDDEKYLVYLMPKSSRSTP